MVQLSILLTVTSTLIHVQINSCIEVSIAIIKYTFFKASFGKKNM